MIEHAAPAELPAFAWPTTLGMSIQDNLGIATAWLEYRRNGGPRIAVGLLPDASDPTLYRTSFPNVGGLIGDTFEYWIIAQDASNAGHVTRLPEVGTFSFALVENLEDGFELERGVWLHRPAVPGRDDPWHVSMQRNHTVGGSRSWLCGEESGGYPVTTAAVLSTDYYLLGEGASASVWSWMDAEPNGPSSAFDGGIVQIFVEGEQSPTLLVPTAGYPRTMGDTADTNIIAPGTPCLSGTDTAWQQLQFDLQPWAGERVQIQFLFGSDNVASSHSGWSLDDFQLSPGIRNPTDTSVALPAAPHTVLQQPPAPNPFNPNVTFRLRATPASGVISLDIVDVRGRLVRRILTGALASGEYQYRWDGRDERGKSAASGVYWYRLRSSMGMETGQLVLVR